MSLIDWRKRDVAELKQKLLETQAQQQDLRFKLSSGQLKTVREVRVLRQQAAQLMTLVQESVQK